MDGWLGSLGRWLGGRIDGWGWMDERMEGSMDGWIDALFVNSPNKFGANF